MYTVAYKATEHVWDELKPWQCARASHLTAVPDLTNALVAEWAQISMVILQNLVESQPRVEVVLIGKGKLNL